MKHSAGYKLMYIFLYTISLATIAEMLDDNTKLYPGTTVYAPRCSLFSTICSLSLLELSLLHFHLQISCLNFEHLQLSLALLLEHSLGNNPPLNLARGRLRHDISEVHLK